MAARRLPPHKECTSRQKNKISLSISGQLPAKRVLVSTEGDHLAQAGLRSTYIQVIRYRDVIVAEEITIVKRAVVHY
jgi:hypothetical protein